MRLLFILGTRPEAIKLCPVIAYCREQSGISISVCVTAQHRGLLDQVLGIFRLTPDYDLNLMRPGQTLFQSTSRIMAGLEAVFEDCRPDMAIVQGDTTTTFCGALGAFYHRVAVGHVEAGLRTGDLSQPFPEEMNRLLTTRLTALHFAATAQSRDNLLAEGVASGRVALTGNPGLDAIRYVSEAFDMGTLARPVWPRLAPDRKLLLVTAHRRENFGAPMERICRALATIAGRTDVQIFFPLHPNPNLAGIATRFLGNLENVQLLAPQDYVSFLDLMKRSYLLITDSGGVQEEGPALGKPVLVLREKTERPEAVEAGTARLVGTDELKIVSETFRLLDDSAEYARMSLIHNPFGDGQASGRIVQAITTFSL